MVKRLMAALFAVSVLSLSAQAFAAARVQGVYIRMLGGIRVDARQEAPKVEAALKKSGFTILAAYENGVPEGCSYKVETIVFTRVDYASKMLARGPDMAFALPLRLSLYEGPAGLNIAMMNPVSVDRTISQNYSLDADAQKVVDEVAVALKTLGPVQPSQIGELRESGKITGIGGGAFPDKIVPVMSSPKSPSEIASALEKGLKSPAGWHVIYVYNPSKTVAVVGITKPQAEGRAFGIAGEARAEKSNPFPGIDHGAAFPVELVIIKKGAYSSISLLKEMWRMKLYFQDAGNWAFMKNMRMPGQIQSEIEEAVKRSVR